MIGASWATGSWTDAWTDNAWAGTPLAPETADLSGIIRLGPRRHVLVPDSTNTVTLLGLRNKAAKLYPVDATVVVTAVLDASGAIVAGTQEIAMPYIAGVGPKSVYRGVIPHYIALVAGPATVRVTATDSIGNVHTFDHPCTVVAG